MYHLTRTSFASDAIPDIVFVDGPPSMLGGREGALLQALSLAGPGSLILLDDASRPEEAALLEGVERRCGDAVAVRLLPDFPRGMAAVTVISGVAIDVVSPETDERRIRARAEQGEPG